MFGRFLHAHTVEAAGQAGALMGVPTSCPPHLSVARSSSPFSRNFVHLPLAPEPPTFQDMAECWSRMCSPLGDEGARVEGSSAALELEAGRDGSWTLRSSGMA